MFDAVYVLGYTGMVERIIPMREELSRVGIDAEIVWNYPSPLDDVIAHGVRLETDRRYLNMILGHYRILKTAKGLGKNHILVLEDDARFMRDVSSMNISLSELPRDYNVAMLDHHWKSGTDHKEIRVNEKWSRCLDGRVSSAAYAMDSSGIEWMVLNYERCFVSNGNWLKCCDQYFNVNDMPTWFNFYIATPNVCIQNPIGNRVTSENDPEAIYRKMGINTKDYGNG